MRRILVLFVVGVLGVMACSASSPSDTGSDGSGPDATSAAGSGMSDSDTVASTATPVTAAPTTTVAPFVSPFVAAEVDGLTPDQAWSKPTDVLAPAAADEDWVIVGATHGGGVHRGAVWESSAPDGADPIRTDLEAGSASALTGVARFGDDVIAVGWSGGGEAQRPAVWRRSSGAWAEVETTGLADEAREFSAVDNLDGVLLARGIQLIDDNPRTSLWVSDDGVEWRSATIDDAGAPDRLVVNAVANGGGAMVAVGTTFSSAKQATEARIWTSGDAGVTWELIPEPDQVLGPEATVLGGVVWFDGEFVAVGSRERNDTSTPAVWRSVDGLRWDGVAIQFSQTADQRRYAAGIGATNLATNGQTLVATSTVSWLMDVWESTDGVQWDLVGNVRALEPEADLPIVDAAIASTGDIMALRSWKYPIAPTPAGTWNPSGSAEQFPEPRAAPSTERVTWGAGRFVVGGQEVIDGGPAINPRFWWSDDGVQWNVENPPTGMTVGAVEAVPDGFIAIGRAVEGETGNDPISVLTSLDGAAWTPAALVGDPQVGSQSVADIAVRGETIFAAGQSSRIDENFLLRATIFVDEGSGIDFEKEVVDHGSDRSWSRRACATDDTAVVFVAVQSVGSTIEPLVYVAGAPRTEAVAVDGSFDGQASQWINSCDADDTGFVAVGVAMVDDDEQPMLWRSDDGQSWSSETLPAEMFGPGSQRGLIVGITPTGFAVIGSDETRHDGSVLWLMHDDRWYRIDNPLGVDDPADVSIVDLVVADDRLVLVGGQGFIAHIWSTPLDDLITAAIALDPLR